MTDMTRGGWLRRVGLAGMVTLVSASLVSATAVHAAPARADGTPWVRHTVAAGPRGADGVHVLDANGDGRQDVATAWEEAGIVTVSYHPDDPRQPWPTVTVGSHLYGVEDAVFADVDRDGNVDVVSACECRQVVVHFAPADPLRILEPEAWTPVTLSDSVGQQRWIKVAVTDVDGDERPDIIGGGKATGAASPATIGWFQAPEKPRDGGWRYTPMSPVGWTMSVLPRDVDGDVDPDVVMSDRTYITNPDGTRTYGLRGSRWLENIDAGASWVSHPIGFARGEHKFLHVTDIDGDDAPDVLDGASGPTYNVTFLRRGLGSWGPWEVTPIPQPQGVGQYQDVKTDDVDMDGDVDMVFSYSHAEGDLAGVVWLTRHDDGSWSHHDISGPPGTKFDNVELRDLDADGDPDVLTTEQIDQLGIVWYENPHVVD